MLIHPEGQHLIKLTYTSLRRITLPSQIGYEDRLYLILLNKCIKPKHGYFLHHHQRELVYESTWPLSHHSHLNQSRQP